MVQRILADITIPGFPGFVIKIPDPGGLFGGGLLSGIGTILQLVFGLTLLVWIVLSLLAGYKILRSQGNPEQIKEGANRLKYMWIAVSVFFGFFIVLTIVGSIVGFRSPIEWGNTLAQCGGYSGPFYFSQYDQQSSYYYTKFNVKVSTDQKAYCCLYASASNTSAADSPLGNMAGLGINNDGYNWYLPLPSSAAGGASTSVDTSGNVVSSTGGTSGLTSCVEFGK